jgi:hypothetical protein
MMKSLISRPMALLFLAALLVGLAGCSAGGGDNMGRLSLSLIDKPTHEYKQVWITIKDIYVHAENDPEGSWTKILDVNRTVNLMTLADGVREELGIVDLAPGHYTQMRLMLGTENSVDPVNLPANYLLDGDDQIQELKIPSGVQSGVKLVQGFDINESSTTRLIFDFDLATSIVAAGNSGKYILRPTIHQIDDSQTRTIIKGFVKNAAGEGVPGANVSLQIYTARMDPPVLDFKEEIVVPYSTTTDGTGAYMFWFLNIPDPTTFNVVATDWASSDPNYGPAWSQLTGVVNGDAYPVPDLTLPVPAEIGTLDLRAIVNDLDTVKVEDNTLVVTISIRQLSDLAGTPMVEVKTLPIVGYDDEWLLTAITAVKVDLPVGDYAVIASTAGRTSLEKTIHISKTGPNAIDFTFPNP